MATPIPAPGVEIVQSITSASPTVRDPDLVPCVVGPCYRVVDAFETDGDVNTSARAGTYQNGAGRVAYNLPSFPTGGDLDEDSVRIFLESGSNAEELNSDDDEVIVQTSAAGWSYDHAGGATFAARQLTLTGGQVTALGLAVGDVIRLTVPANGPVAAAQEIDVVIEAIAGAPNQNTIVQIELTSSWGFDLVGVTYKLVQDAAEFEVHAAAQQSTRRIMNASAVANNGVDLVAPLTDGSLGDSVQLSFSDVPAAALAVEIVEQAVGWDIQVTYDSTNVAHTWAALATAINAANDALPVGGRPLASPNGATAVGTGAVAMAALASLVSLGDIDGTGVFLLDGGADANTVLLDADLLDLHYNITSTAVVGYALVQYRALRLDKSAQAAVPTLLEYENDTEMVADIGPVDTRNPLALMFQKAFDNAPGVRISGIGLHEVSAQFPEGTVAAYSAAFTFLSAREVYAVAPLSQAPQVDQLLNTHVLAFSAPEEKHERIGFFAPALPTNANDDVQLSGTSNGETFDSGGGDIDGFRSGDNFSVEGILVNDVLVLASESGPYELGNGLSGWLINAVTANDIGLSDEDVDANPTADFPTEATALSWTIYRPGAAIVSAADQATAVAEYSESFLTRRMYHVFAPEITATVGGVQQRIGGGYAAAAVVGQLGRLAPQLPQTNRPLSGIDAVHNTNERFSESQLNLIAASNYILVQDRPGGAVYCRQQNSTDTSTAENQHLSITKVLDYLAKFLRGVLKPFTGSMNIDAGYLDMINSQIEGHRSGFLARKLVADFKLNSLEQDPAAPTRLLVDCSVQVFYPGDYIRLTLSI